MFPMTRHEGSALQRGPESVLPGQDPAVARVVFEHSNDAIFVVDVESDEILACNAKACEMLGYSQDELLATPISRIHPHEMPSLLPFARSVLESGAGWTSDLSCTTKSGAVLAAEISASVVDFDGRPCMIALVRDMSRLERTQRQARRLEAMVEAQRALVEINLAISAHLDTSKLFEMVGEAVRRVMPHDRLAVILPDTDSTALRLFALDAHEAKTSLQRCQLFEPTGFMPARVIETGVPFIARRRTELAQFPASQAILEREGMQATLGYPLVAGSKTVGVLVLMTAEADERWGDLEVLRGLAPAIAVAVDNALAYAEIHQLKSRLEQENTYLRTELTRGQEIVGTSRTLGRVLDQVAAVAKTRASVLVLGESGVGKELIARAIHEASPRADRPLIKVNCASIPRELFESEFFGHVRGAFTGALKHRDGRFQLADGGTLFLDEVGEIPIELQGKLLRVLQEQEFEKVGDDKTRRVDVRVIAATNRDLEAEVAQGRFREDLYYRLSVFPVQVPPLRERREDIGTLARHFLAIAARELGVPALSLSDDDARALETLDWPGNARELRNAMERAAIMSTDGTVRLDVVRGRQAQTAPPPESRTVVRDRVYTAGELRELERLNIIAALEKVDWQVSGHSGAARLLDLKPSTLASRMRALQIKRDA